MFTTPDLPPALFAAGDQFTVTHSDGVTITETVHSAIFYGSRWFYVCDSCACYSDSDL